MGKIVAIFGGDNGHGSTKYELKEIDDEVVRLTGKKNPNFLLLAFGNKFENSYMTVMRNIYSKYGANMQQITRSMLSNHKLCKEKIATADIIYIGGGDARFFMRKIRLIGMDKLLIEAYNRGAVLVGDCCGTVCFGRFGNSDSRKFALNEQSFASKEEYERQIFKNMFKISGLGLIDVLMCPHYDRESYRKESLKRMMKTTYKIPAIAGECGVALEVVDGKFRFIRSIPTAKVMKTYWKNNNYIVEELPITDTYSEISNLTKRG